MRITVCKYIYIYIQIYIYMLVDQNSFIRKRPFFANPNVTFAKLSRTPRLSFAGPMLGNNASYEDSFTTCQITPENHGSLLDSLFNHAASIRESLLRADCCWLVFFCKVYWPTPFNMHFDFRPLLRRTFAKISLFTDPGHQQGAHWRKSEHQGPWCLALAKPHFWKLGCCVWSLFLETSKIIIRQWQRQVQGCASGPWCLAVAKPHLWKLGCYLWRAKWLSKSTSRQGTEPEPNRNSPVPFSCQTPGGSGWQPFTYSNDYNIQLSPDYFREKKCYFREIAKKLSRGFPT